MDSFEMKRNHKLKQQNKLPHARYTSRHFNSRGGLQVKLRNEKYKDLQIPKGLTDDQLQEYILYSKLPKKIHL